MYRILIIAFAIACSRDKPPPSPSLASGSASHAAMPNQLEVGSTLDGRYRIVQKLGEVGDTQVFAVEHVTLEKTFVLLAPTATAPSTAGAALHDAAKRQAARGVTGEISVDDFGSTAQGIAYVVLSASPDQQKQLLSGSLDLGG